MTSALLTVENLSKSFAGLRAIDDVTFALEAGRVLGIIGPNGAGKSTLINLVTGLYRPDGGSIVFDGAEVGRETLTKRARRGLMRSFQHTRVFETMTVRDAIRLASESPRGRSQPNGPDVDELLARFGIAAYAESLTGELPYGVQKVVNLAQVARCAPRVILLDEPFAGVGPADVERLSSVIQVFRDDGVAIGLVEHNIEALLRLVDEVIVLDAGRLIFTGTGVQAGRSVEVRNAYLGPSLDGEEAQL